jgi:serine protein kinase
MMLTELIAGYRDENRGLAWEGAFEEYLRLVEENPKVARLAHARVFDMIRSHGVEKDTDGKITRYNFFGGEIFGSDAAVGDLVEYFKAAAHGLEVRKRILLLMGPAGGGKSSIVTLLKKRLEAYSRSPEGALYGIVGCPMHEEPLHLLPEELRRMVREQYGIHIEGDLCPVCHWRLQNEWGGDFQNARVERVLFSEMGRVGIGTFSPSDPKTQDVAELIGSMDLARIGQVGSESDPRAWRFDGELNIANRGIMEFIELLKSDPKFLYLLLNLAQEQRIKAPRYPLIYADEIVISHTNEAEFTRFLGEKTNEALQDRMHVVRVPYNLSVSDEAKIHDKLLRQGSIQIHLAPNTTRVAAMFGVLTRLEDVEGKKKIGLVDKMRLYDGKKLEGWTDYEVKTLKEESPREGMEGAGPRFIVDALSKALSQPEIHCMNPIQALRGIMDHLDHHPQMDPKKKELYRNHIGRVRDAYHDILKKEVMTAFVTGFAEQAKALVWQYLAEANAWRKKDKITDPITQQPREADERFMRAIEEQIGVSEHAKKEFREEIVARVADLALAGKTFDYTSHDRLKEAVDRKLFGDVKSVVKTVVQAKVADADQQRRVDQVVESMLHQGYCKHCAREVLRYMSRIID